MSTPLQVLLVEDSADDAELLLAELRRSGFAPQSERVETAEAMRVALAARTWDIVISDHAMPNFSATEALQVLRQSGQDLPFIIVSGSIGEEIAVAMMKTGANDYLLKDNLKRLAPVVRRELAEAEGRRQRARAEAELRKLSRAVEQGPASVVITNALGAVEYINPKFTEVTGYTLDEVRGQNLRIIKSGFTPAAVYADLWASITSGREWRGELQNRRKNGDLYWEQVVISPLRDAGGAITHFVAVKLDISDKKQLEARFLQAQRLENLGALASGLAHDLNNMLAPVLMGTRVLQTRTTDPMERRMLATMEASAKRGADIVRQVLTFARGIEGDRAAVQVRHLLRDMAEIATETFPPTVKLTTDFAKDLWPVLGDATQLHQVLMNLCINARDSMPRGGKLQLQAENLMVDETFAAMTPGAKAGPHICIKIADTGTGIAPEHAGRIFEPFFTTKEKGKGTGLGLATVLGIVRSHGGFLRFHSEPGRGTCFDVFLPAAPAAVPVDDTAAVEPIRGTGEGILVVDDEPAIREVATRVLEHFGYRPFVAADGTEAVVAYVQNPGGISAVLTDMLMPGMDGPTLIRTLHRLNPHLPVVAMTGTEEAARLSKSDVPGLGTVLIKPFTANQLLVALHNVLHLSPPARTHGSKKPWAGNSSTPFPDENPPEKLQRQG